MREIYLGRPRTYELPKNIIEERNFIFKWTGKIDDLLDCYYEMSNLNGYDEAKKIIVEITNRDLHFCKPSEVSLDNKGNVTIIGLKTRLIRE